jgi:toxin YoeB
VTWTVLYTTAAQRDVKTIRKRYPHLQAQLEHIDEQLRKDPLHHSHRFEALRGDLRGYYSRRLDNFHRVVYRLEKPDVVVVSCLGHYGDT